MDELLDVVDENGQPTGQTEMKYIIHRDGIRHRVVHIWFYNNQGQVLMQKRSLTKKVAPGEWDTAAAGHVDAGEDILDAALRETHEELGHEINQDNLEFLGFREEKFETNGLKNHEMMATYLYLFNGDIADLTLQEEEVQEVRWFTTHDIKHREQLGEQFTLHGEFYQKLCDEVEARTLKSH